MIGSNWRTAAAVVAALGLSLAGAARAQTPTAYPPNAYDDPKTWLCRPDIGHDACDIDLDATVVRADGSTSVQPFHRAAHPALDCFYVYPTVSTDPGVISTMAAEPAELRVVAQQFARFGASCRLFAPLYRQFTLTALAAAMRGQPLPGSSPRPTAPFDDVRDAWRWYLSHENHGRGVVLIGHSQGSGVLTELIKREIEGRPEQARLVSALLMGTVLTVPKGADVGGDFKSIPLCRSDRQLGCAVAFASFRETSPPPPNTRFGRPRTPAPGMEAACVNPANLSGGPGPLDSYFPARAAVGAAGQEGLTGFEWDRGHPIDTPFVTLPGMLSARCVNDGAFDYLSIHIAADAAGPRAHEIPGDVIVGGQILRDWGLHLIDANLTIGNLVELVRHEGEAWSARKP